VKPGRESDSTRAAIGKDPQRDRRQIPELAYVDRVHTALKAAGSPRPRRAGMKLRDEPRPFRLVSPRVWRMPRVARKRQQHVLAGEATSSTSSSAISTWAMLIDQTHLHTPHHPQLHSP
jgi:hypothetical protein